MERTEYHYYSITIDNPREHSILDNFVANNPTVEARNPFGDIFEFYPVYYDVIVASDTAQETAFLICFPRAQLRTVFYSSSVALG